MVDMSILLLLEPKNYLVKICEHWSNQACFTVNAFRILSSSAIIKKGLLVEFMFS